KIVIAGYTRHSNRDPNTHFALARLNPDGTPDAAFGASGQVLGDETANDRANAVAIAPDGTIVAAGVLFPDDGSAPGFDLRFYNPANGAQTSMLLSTFDGGPDIANAVVIQSDGK